MGKSLPKLATFTFEAYYILIRLSAFTLSSKGETGVVDLHLVSTETHLQHHQKSESNTRTEWRQIRTCKDAILKHSETVIFNFHPWLHLESNCYITFEQPTVLFAIVFFQTKPVVQALDPDTQIWEEARIESFEGTNHVRVNFTGWGKTRTMFGCFFVTPKFILKSGQSGKLLKKFFFPDDTILIILITNWITLRKNSRKAI